MFDQLGVRMKEYEACYKTFIPKKTPVIVRVDGKAFHTFTKSFEKPFDYSIVRAMDYATLKIIENSQNAKMAFTQSDEISILFSDFDSITTEPWFGNNLQKIVSVSASLATAHFNEYLFSINKEGSKNKNFALFDSRVFILPIHEVENYFIWRQADCSRNSIQSLAQSKFSHKQLDGKGRLEQLAMLKEVGCDWEKDIPYTLRMGRTFVKHIDNVVCCEFDTCKLIDDEAFSFQSMTGRELIRGFFKG